MSYRTIILPRILQQCLAIVPCVDSSFTLVFLWVHEWFSILSNLKNALRLAS